MRGEGRRKAKGGLRWHDVEYCTEAELNIIDQELPIAVRDFMDLVVTNGANLIFPFDSFAKRDGGFTDLRMAIKEASSDKVTKMAGG